VQPLVQTLLQNIAVTRGSKASENSNKLQILTYPLPAHIAMAEYYCEQLNYLGLACEYKVEEFPVFSLNETADKADIIISGEVFCESIMDMNWLGWLKGCSSLEAFLSDEQTVWRDQTLETISNEPDENKRADLFNQMEAELIAAGIYLPLFHVQQQLNQADSLNPMELLANGWIDFNRVTFK